METDRTRPAAGRDVASLARSHNPIDASFDKGKIIRGARFVRVATRRQRVIRLEKRSKGCALANIQAQLAEQSQPLTAVA